MNDDQNEFANDLSTPAYGQQPPQPQKSWFGRNWLWFLPTVILLPIFCCCGGGGALVWFSVGKVLDIAPYKDSVALAEQSAEVQSQLGTPLDAPEGFMDLVSMMQSGGQFNFNQTNNQMLFDAQVPISGPNGSGTLWIEAQSPDGGVTWTYTRQELELPDGTMIDLLPAGSRGATPAPNEGSPDDASAEDESTESDLE